jgi:hypothetical protein
LLSLELMQIMSADRLKEVDARVQIAP